ncbi:right-handed parallel beta-helix repeat-containing protein [Lentzea sp. NPDC004789]
MIALTAIASQAAHAEPGPQAGTTYYVNSQNGDDTASGLDSGHAWRSFSRVNGTTFQPGDRILLSAGSHWTGQLWPKGSGTASRPITIDRYGSGAAPRVDGAGQVADAVRLANQQFWTIRGLEVTNQAAATGTPGQNLKGLRGIHVTGDRGGKLEGFVIDGVRVHDVTGEVNWISGDTAGDKPGIRFRMGWDRSKRTGGIVFDTGVPNPQAPPATPTTLNGITVQNSVITNTSFAGIVVKQYTGDAPGAVATGWGTRTRPDDAQFAPHTNVVIRGNHISHPNTDYGCNGIYLTDVRHALIEHNVVNRAGTSGIETYFADDVTIQLNEVSETRQRAGGADSNGIDPDKGTTRQVVQYNYTHDNGDGILLCQFAFGDVVVRYNVIARNTRYQVYLHSDPASRASVYNNTIYNTRSDYAIYGYGKSLQSTYDITNNIIYSTVAHAALTTGSTVRYRNNLYGGATLPIPADDTSAVKGDPRFTATPGQGTGTPESGPRLDLADSLKPRAGSPAIGAGARIDDPGARDFAGTPLYQGKPDIGAFES